MAQKRLNFAHIRVGEPAGPRSFDATVGVGGEGAQIVVPGCGAGSHLRFEREDAIWFATPVADSDGHFATVRFNGVVLREPRDLRTGDVLSVGDAQIVLGEVTRTLLRLDVKHLAGNETIPPFAAITDVDVGLASPDDADAETEDLEIRAAELPKAPASGAVSARPQGRLPRFALAGVAAALLIVLGVLASIETISLDVVPREAQVSLPGTAFSFHVRGRVYVFPGRHTVRARYPGYRPAQTSLAVEHAAQPAVHLRLLKLPGTLAIDSAGVQAIVLIDGVEIGRAPGDVVAPAGLHTVIVRAPRYLDRIETITIEGAGHRQSLRAQLLPSWGTLAIAADPGSSRIQVDGAESGIAPASLDLPAGMHRVSLIAPGYRSWESSIVIRPGERLQIGPVKLGAPEAVLNVRSQPSGGEVSVAGSYRGRTPLRLSLPPEIAYDVVVSLPGHASFAKSVFAAAGAVLAIDARLAESAANVRISGDPPDAQVVVDDIVRGAAPESLALDAADHRIEIRKTGFVPYRTTITVSPGLERQVIYHLPSQERSIALRDSASTVTAGIGYALRLIPGDTSQLASEHREQAHRSSAGFHRVVLRRPFYLGIHAVSNADFRRFHAAHVSGFIGKRSLDLDEQPVVQVSWDEAAEFCNWLSAQDGLPLAYHVEDGRQTLIQPQTTGYRLPTEAEWGYALPVAARSGNFAGTVPEWLNDWNGNKHAIRGAAKSSVIGFRIARYAE